MNFEKTNIRILMGGAPHKINDLEEFGKALDRIGLQCKIVTDIQVYDGFNIKKILKWLKSRKKFSKLVNEFQPDVVLVDRPHHFALAVLETKFPLVFLLRGDYWAELKSQQETLERTKKGQIKISKWEKNAKKCFEGSILILPVSNYLSKIVKENYPEKKVEVIHNGVDSQKWYPQKGMNLKHPCVGLVQSGNIWGKAREMLILPKILEAMPNVNFYWAGDGQFREKILQVLNKYDNFKWLGKLDYPDKVREFFTEMDVYALISGLDMTPKSVLEAQLMEKPVVVSNVGGVSETMKDNETGFLVDCGDYKGWIEKLSILIENADERNQMGAAGAKFVKENFSWEESAKDFEKIIRKINEV